MERAVRLVFESGRPIAHVAAGLGIHPEALRKRVRRAETDAVRRTDRTKLPILVHLVLLPRKARQAQDYIGAAPIPVSVGVGPSAALRALGGHLPRVVRQTGCGSPEGAPRGHDPGTGALPLLHGARAARCLFRKPNNDSWGCAFSLRAMRPSEAGLSSGASAHDASVAASGDGEQGVEAMAISLSSVCTSELEVDWVTP
jgi:hypothetical protein